MPPRRRSADARVTPPTPPTRTFSPSRLFKSKSTPTSAPMAWRNIKGIMRVATLEDSLHSKYGDSDDYDTTVDKNGRKKHKIRIKFQNIEIREYARTVGDNPSVSSGPPVTISWEYNPNTTVLSVEEYEKSRPTRRTQSEMILPRSLRMEMLRKEWNVSQQQIASAVRSGIRAKSQRRTTLGNLGKTEKVEELIEGATKQLLRTLFLRKSTSKIAQELEDEIQKVNKQRAQNVLTHNMKDEFSDDSESPWTADLLPDDSDMDVFEGGVRRARDGPPQLPPTGRDGKPTLPAREMSEREASDLELDVSASTAKSAEGDAVLVHHLQSTGESASQEPPLKSRKQMITAVEPEDDDIILAESNASEKRPSVHVDC